MPTDPTGRLAYLAAGVTLVAILLGCMSISIGKFSEHKIEDGGLTLCQEDEVTVPAGGERDVYYPIPYPCPPHLEICDSFSHLEIVEQREDHFRVKNTSAFRQTGTWKARGLKAPVHGPPAPAAPPPVPPPEGAEATHR
jgi:hypothetical protein